MILSPPNNSNMTYTGNLWDSLWKISNRKT